jgi:Domain of unknown function (DUF4352)
VRDCRTVCVGASVGCVVSWPVATAVRRPPLLESEEWGYWDPRRRSTGQQTAVADDGPQYSEQSNCGNGRPGLLGRHLCQHSDKRRRDPCGKAEVIVTDAAGMWGVMRSTVSLGVALAMVLAVAGCTRSTDNHLNPTTEAPSDASSATTITTAIFSTLEESWGAMATVEGGQITADPPMIDSGAQALHADGEIFYCNVTLVNIGSAPIAYDQADFELTAEYQAWTGGYGGVATLQEPTLGAGVLQPGRSVKGAVSFEFDGAVSTESLTLRFMVSWYRRITVIWH